MRLGVRGMVAAAIATVALGGYALTVAAQEGHPLKGSWLGTWEGNQAHGEFVLIVLDWDGQAITGMINPGTDNIRIEEATLDPETWSVHFEAPAEDAQGGRLTYVVEGRIENLELPDRSIVGTWRSERGNGSFEVSRQ